MASPHARRPSIDMHRRFILQRGLFAGALVALTAYGCDRPNPYKLAGDGQVGADCPPIDPTTTGSGTSSASGGPTGGTGAGGPGTTELDERVVDYGEALRTASLKLVGNLPTLRQIIDLTEAVDQRAYFEAMVDQMLSDPRFEQRMIEYWRSVFQMQGDGLDPGAPSRDTAPVFAARMVVENRPWTDLLLATTDTCPTYDVQTGEFVPGECNNGTTPAGVLTDPGIHSLYYGNMAFRRNRFFHEVFLCRNGNAPGGAEPTTEPSTAGPCTGEQPPPNYTSPWPMDRIAGECNGGQVDFHEYNTTVVCANCHATWNHRAPLFANFDIMGQFQATPQVPVPVEGSPLAQMSDWLVPGEPTAWKFGMPAANLTQLGQVMADDPEVQSCAVRRIWNYAMSRGDIVDNETTVPTAVIEPYVADFVESGFKPRDLLRSILLSDDFVSF